MHRVLRRSSRHVSECVAAGRGRRRRSRSCIPRCEAAPGSAALALACFLSSSELARRVRLLLMCRARPSVSSSRAAINYLRSCPLSPRAKLSAAFTVYYLLIFTHCPTFFPRDEVDATLLRIHDQDASISHSDTMSCGERTGSLHGFGSANDDATRWRHGRSRTDSAAVSPPLATRGTTPYLEREGEEKERG